jgi:hypothetical protein
VTTDGKRDEPVAWGSNLWTAFIRPMSLLDRIRRNLVVAILRAIFTTSRCERQVQANFTFAGLSVSDGRLEWRSGVKGLVVSLAGVSAWSSPDVHSHAQGCSRACSIASD